MIEDGPPVDTLPAQRPAVGTLTGRYCRVEALDADRHGDDLWAALRHDASLWAYMAYGPFQDQRSFAEWLGTRAALADPIGFAVVDADDAAAAGIVTLMEIRPEMRVIEIGNIVLAPRLQRTRAATEAQYLMARHAFEDLGYRRYEWKCNALNRPSRRAALRLGFAFEGIFRQHMIVKGRNRDTAWYAMIDRDWPARKQALESWLAPENFDHAGRQKNSLAAFAGPA